MEAEKKQRSLLYDKSQIDWQNLLYGRRALFALLIPVIIEQLLNSLMGMVDTMMVSNVSSEAISAVSLVDSVNNLVIQVFAALAAGATIICAQYLGKKDKEGCNRAAGQVFLTVTAISTALTVLCVVFRKPLLSLVFGKVDEEVMADCLIYFLLTGLSYPFMALFSTGSSLYRAAGNSRFPMIVSVISNIGNVAGNAIFIFGLHMGVAGAALSTLLSRMVCTVVVLIALRKRGQDIVVRDYLRIRPDFRLIGMILAVGIPSGIENGMFQFGKLAIQSTVSTMGTAAIAAQAMTIILEMLNGIGAIGVGIGLMTVVGQCIGAGRVEEAKYYIVKLTACAEVILAVSCVLTLLLTKPVILLGGMEAESGRLCMEMMIAITIMKPLVWVLSFIPGYGMRAAGDVRFSMIISSATMWLCRVALCIYLVRVWGFGPMAVWIGMFADWSVRSILFGWRFLSGRWLRHNVLYAAAAVPGYPPGEECAQCGGRCCKEHGCVLAPEDLLRALAGKEPDEESLLALFQDEKKGWYAIEYLSAPQGACFYVRMRHKCYTFIGVDAMGECIALGAGGCLLPMEERPRGGRMLKSSPDRHCVQHYTAEQMCADWQPYQELLGRIYREWHARMTDDGTFDRCDEAYFAWLREKRTEPQ